MTAEGPALVTGASGYIGSFLVRALLAQGREVHGLLRAGSRLEALGADADRVVWHRLDGSTESVVAAVARARPTVCFHLAAHFRASHGVADVVPLIEANVVFGAQLAEGLARAAVPYMVNTGTLWQHFQGEAYNPVALYAATRESFVALLRFYTETTPLRAVTLELADTYGPRDPRGKIVSIARRAVGAPSPLGMSGGEQLLDLVHVDDAVDAFLSAEAQLRSGALTTGSFLVSSGEIVSVRQLVELVARVSGLAPSVTWGALPYRPRDRFGAWPRPLLPGWRARIALEEGLRRLEESDPR